MLKPLPRWATPIVMATCVLTLFAAQTVRAETPASTTPVTSKDIGPANPGCDRFEKSSAAWTACVGSARPAMPSEEAFYAGYWLAKTGRYEEALGFLTRASEHDERVLTYIGFATRKLGDVDGAMPFYSRALVLNPNYAVARAYLGDAYLTKGEPGKAKKELSEIEWRCGASCAEYAELASHIADFEARKTSIVR
ncbi:MAG: tetratricopeptide repeat protein [Hyphomicrobium sp.]